MGRAEKGGGGEGNRGRRRRKRGQRKGAAARAQGTSAGGGAGEGRTESPAARILSEPNAVNGTAGAGCGENERAVGQKGRGVDARRRGRAWAGGQKRPLMPMFTVMKL